MITIKSEKRPYGVNFPTSIDEITPEALNEICKDIKLPKHYCVVALCFKTKIFDFVTVIKRNSQDTQMSVIPRLAKISSEDASERNVEVGDKLIVDRSSLERGSHVNCRTVISSEQAQNYFASDENLVKKIMNPSETDYGFSDLTKHVEIVIVEFKIIPVVDIAAAIPMKPTNKDPFINVDDANKE